MFFHLLYVTLGPRDGRRWQTFLPQHSLKFTCGVGPDFCEVKKNSRKISTKVHERKIVPEMRLWDTWARKRFCVLLQQRYLREQLRDHLSLYGVRGESPLTYHHLNLDNFLSASVRTTLW